MKSKSRKMVAYEMFLEEYEYTLSEVIKKSGVKKTTIRTWVSWWRNGKGIPKR